VKEDTLNEFSDMLKFLADPKFNTSTANVPLLVFSFSLPQPLAIKTPLESLSKTVWSAIISCNWTPKMKTRDFKE
jgi:hypothetical protein